MQVIRSSIDTQKGPDDWFTGDVYIDAVAAPAGSSTFGAAAVHFTPGARTAWHTHPHGQTIFVTEGVGLCQREGGPVEIIRPGDRVFFESVIRAPLRGAAVEAGKWGPRSSGTPVYL
jgi:quercetin dioxygenase-like cupin family protein